MSSVLVNPCCFVNYPKADPVYIYSTNRSREFSITTNSQIRNCGVNLDNGRGGIQSEFGYIIEAERVNQPRQTKKGKKGKSKLLSIHKRETEDNYEGTFKWIAASALLQDARALDLVRRYHSQHPRKPKPYGYDKLAKNTLRQ